MSQYTVTAERSGKWWVLQAKEAPGAISQVARLDQADVIREAIAFVTGEAEEDVQITVNPVLPADVTRRLELAEQLRSQAAAAQSQAAQEVRAAAREMKDAQMTMRDIGSILDVSYQRASQLVNS